MGTVGIPGARAVLTVRAAIYCRISLARHGDTVKVDDQEKLCLAVAKQRGWTVNRCHVYKDNSRSAWQRNRKRPGWDAMLEAVANGEIDAIVVYHGDRLIRQPWDLEVLLRLADEKGIKLASPTGERNLDNPDDRYNLRIEAAGQCRESDNTSRRMKWHFEKKAEQGIVRLGGRGGRATGFKPDGITHHRRDVKMIREGAGRVLAGEKVGEICRDLNRRGWRTPAGNEWDHGALKKMLLRPRLAGLLPHRYGLRPAAWKPILDRETWEALCAVLERKAAGFSYATNARRYLLTGLARCGTCGEPLAIRHNTREESLRGYGCIAKGCPKKVHRSVQHLDAYIEGVVIEMLNDERIRARLQPAAAPDLAAKLARAEQRKRELLAAFADDDDAGPDVIRETVGPLSKRIEAMRAELVAARTAGTLDAMWGIALDGWRRLGAAPGGLAKQRTTVAALVRVTVLASGRRGPGFDPKSVRVEPVG